MMNVMMHYSGNEDNLFVVPSALGPRQSAQPGAEKHAPEGSSLALAQFPPSHVGRESPQSLSARHGDDDGCSRQTEHAQSLLVSSGLALQLYARPVDGQSFFAGRSWACEQSLPAPLGLALQRQRKRQRQQQPKQQQKRQRNRKRERQ